MTPFKKRLSFNSPAKQQGAVLIISLVLLIALTIIVLSSARSSTMEVMMGVNSEAQTAALANAEDSARAGELFILNQYQAGNLVRDFAGDANTPWVFAPLNNANVITQMDWAALGTFQDAIGNEYIIEFMGFIQESLGGVNAGLGDRLIYRVSGLGQSSNGTARIVQTYYATLVSTP